MDKLTIAGIRFIVTSVCNYNCLYCHNEWEAKEKPLTKIENNLIDRLISSAKELGAKEVDLTGGEPLLEIDRVKAILLSSEKNGLWTNITTNGFYLKENLENLKRWGLKEIHIHIPSLSPEKYASIMRGNSNLNKVLEAVNLARGSFGKIMINIPIEKGVNDQEIPKFISYFGDRGIIPRFIESMSTKNYLALNKENIENLIDNNLGEIKKIGSYLWGINIYELGKYKFEVLRCICFDKKCHICHKTNFIHIDKDYKVKPCNLRKKKIKINEKNIKESLIKAYKFLKRKNNIPKKYQKIWGEHIL